MEGIKYTILSGSSPPVIATPSSLLLMVIFTSWLKPVKLEAWICVRPLPIYSSVMPLHPPRALVPKLVTLSGMVTSPERAEYQKA